MTEPLVLVTGSSSRGWHRLQSFLECPQRFAWEHRYGVRGFDSDEARCGRMTELRAEERAEVSRSPNLIRGSLVHLGLSHHYARLRESQQGRDPELYLPWPDAMKVVSQKEGPVYRYHCDEMIDCVEAYIRHYADRDDFEVLHVEELIEGKIFGHTYTGRLDLVTRSPDGRIWAWDHKTTGRIEKKHKIFYSVSGQLLGYRWLLTQVYGDKVAGLRVNLIQNNKDQGFAFDRPLMDPAPHLFRNFAERVARAEELIREYDQKYPDYTKWPAAMNEMTCYGRYGACPHIEKCRMGEAIG